MGHEYIISSILLKNTLVFFYKIDKIGYCFRQDWQSMRFQSL